MEKKILITIDGPSGAGKTTASKLLAQKLGYRYLDTGALYRAVAVAAHARGISADDENGLERLCRTIRIDLQSSGKGLHVLLEGRDISGEIRAPHISMLASAVSAKSAVRRFLLSLQRRLGEEKGVVAEGRDMGTVVFPLAEVKFFLDADPHARAVRRYTELSQHNPAAPTLAEVEKDMIRRDHDDSTRTLAPLAPAADALRIDSTRLSLEQVLQRMLSHIAERTAPDDL